MLILRHADHGHFGDHIAVEVGLCPKEHAHLFTRGLALAHLDAVLREDQTAARFMTDDPAGALPARDVDAFAYDGRTAGS